MALLRFVAVLLLIAVVGLIGHLVLALALKLEKGVWLEADDRHLSLLVVQDLLGD